MYTSVPSPFPPWHPQNRKKDKMSCLNLIDLHNNELSLSMTKPTKWVAKDPKLLHADSEDSDRTGQMPRLTCACTLRTEYRSFCWFCLAVAHIYVTVPTSGLMANTQWSFKKLMASFKERPGDIQSFFTLFFEICSLERVYSFQHLNKSSKSCCFW